MQWARSSERVAGARRRWGVGPWSRELLLQAGWTPRQLERDVHAGRLVRVQRGVYAPSGAEPAWDQPSSYAAMLSRAGPDAVVSHESAARVHRLWLPYPSDDRVHLTVPGRPVTTDPRVRRHQSPLDPSEIVVLGGVRVTGVARTAVDLARGKAFAQALVPLDSAIRRVAVGEAAHTAAARTLLAAGRGELRVAAARAELDQAARRAARWPGARIVSRCLPYADPRSESPYESWSRGVLIEAGMAPEALGLEVRGASGKVYYADLAWPSRRVLGEADGLTKYGDDARTVRERLSAERHRQRDLEDAGWIVVRWSAGERAAVLTARVGGALSGPGVRVA